MVATAYGLSVLAIALLAWLSRDRTVRLVWLIIALTWLANNLAIGDDRFWMLNPAGIATDALAAAVVTHLPRNRLTVTVFLLFGLKLTNHLVAAAAQTTTQRSYFDLNNGMFALQLLATGGWGVWCALRHWHSLGPDRSGVVLAPRATLVRRRPF